MDVYENSTFAIEGSDLAFIQNTLGGNLERRRDGWAITRLVGHLALPSGRALRIRSPKATGAAVLSWMAFVDPTLAGLRFVGRVPEAVDAGDVATLATRLFFIELFAAIQRHGVGRAYVRTRAYSSAVRGRIDFAALARQGGNYSKLPCQLWERQPDTPLNRLLAAAIDAIARDIVLRGPFATDIRRAQVAFTGVPPQPNFDTLSGTVASSRTAQPYLAVEALARILITGAMLGEGQASPGVGFLVNLETLFEKTVVRALTAAKLDIDAKAKVPYSRTGEHGRHTTHSMEADVVIRNLNSGPIVVDAKYKSTLSASNIQQMITYCFVLGARIGVLVVPGGITGDLRSYNVVPPTDGKGGRSSTINIHVVELETGATTVEQWRDEAAKFVRRLALATSNNAMQLPVLWNRKPLNCDTVTNYPLPQFD